LAHRTYGGTHPVSRGVALPKPRRHLANLTTVNSGGKEDVVFNGITSVTQVNSGGLAFIQSGGQVLGGLTLAGGTAAISGSMAAGQSVTFIGPGGDLALFNLPDFGAAIGGFGFGDQIDLATIPLARARPCLSRQGQTTQAAR
jgi:autotransporter passenger strand-loop-strand repeat protein